MSDSVQLVFNSIPDSRQVGSEGARSSRSSAQRKRSRLSSAEFDEITKTEIDRPYGLAIRGNNCLNSHRSSELIKMGVIDKKDIIADYRKMLLHVDKKRSPLMVNGAGEVVTFPVKSRWNSEYNYGWIVGQKALDEVKGLRKVTHLVLTFDYKIIEKIIPDWWPFDITSYLTVAGSYFVSDFIRQYRYYKKKKGEPYNFITWVLEFRPSDCSVHYHLLFFGGWVAPIEDLCKFWPYSQPQGIRFGKPIRHHDNGAVLASYLTRYITKDLSPKGDVDPQIKSDMEFLRALLWLYKKRLYNIRHHVQNSDGVYTLGIGRDQYVYPIKWSLYHSESDRDDVTARRWLRTEAKKIIKERKNEVCRC
ncbi:MAG: hypothetical protein ABSF13_13600 [Smithella sp.]